MTEAPAQGRGARSRDAILDTAGELMSRYGYAATSISMISTACGLPVSSIYWHFASKDGIYVAVLERARTVLLAALPRARCRAPTSRSVWTPFSRRSRTRSGVTRTV